MAASCVNQKTVLELYCGIGGLHQACILRSLPFRIIPFDINDVASKVYEHNFHVKVNRTNLETITTDEIEHYNSSIWLMSPPCQPYNDCVMSKKLDLEDKRGLSLRHLIVDILPTLRNKPERILLENVKGFLSSKTREVVVDVLTANGYNIKELLASPNQFGIPNQRQRYFLLAKHQPLTFRTGIDPITSACNSQLCLLCHRGPTVSFFLENQTTEMFNRFSVPQNVLLSHGLKFDIVCADSNRTCCFTKGYTKIVEGTGSVLITQNITTQQFEHMGQITDPKLLEPLHLRYFTPREVARLHGFPDSYAFPNGLTDKALFRLFGNSLNCVVLSHLIEYLLED